MLQYTRTEQMLKEVELHPYPVMESPCEELHRESPWCSEFPYKNISKCTETAFKGMVRPHVEYDISASDTVPE